MLEAVIKHLRLALGKDIHEPDVLGFHGTSQETLKFLLDRGVLPGSQYMRHYGSRPQIPGEIYFFTPEANEEDEGLQGAKSYARFIAQSHFLIRSLNLNLGDYKHRMQAADALLDTDGGVGQLARTSKKKAPVIEKLITQAPRFKGVILALSTAILSTYKVEPPTVHGDEGHRILTNGDGLPYSLINGLIPLGDEERRFIKEKISRKRLSHQ